MGPEDKIAPTIHNGMGAIGLVNQMFVEGVRMRSL
jgi:hypothetical protein